MLNLLRAADLAAFAELQGCLKARGLTSDPSCSDQKSFEVSFVCVCVFTALIPPI